MKQIGSLFDVYRKKLKPPQASVEVRAAEIIAEITGLSIQSSHLSYSPATRTLRLQAPSVLRSEVLKRKLAVLQALSSLLGEQHCPKELI